MLVGGYLIDNAHPKTAIALLDGLPDDVADSVQRTQFEILKANAFMRIPEKMWDARAVSRPGAAAAQSVPEADRRQAAIANVHKEKGYLLQERWTLAESR